MEEASRNTEWIWEPQETTMLDLIYFLLIGLAAGWLAGKIMNGGRS